MNLRSRVSRLEVGPQSSDPCRIILVSAARSSVAGDSELKFAYVVGSLGTISRKDNERESDFVSRLEGFAATTQVEKIGQAPGEPRDKAKEKEWD